MKMTYQNQTCDSIYVCYVLNYYNKIELYGLPHKSSGSHTETNSPIINFRFIFESQHSWPQNRRALSRDTEFHARIAIHITFQ